MRDPLRAGVRPVRGGKGVIHVEIGHRCELTREGRVVGLLAGVEPGVLQHQHVAVRHRRDRSLAPLLLMQSAANATGRPNTSPSACAIGASDIAVDPFTLRPVKVAADDHPRATVRKLPNGRRQPLDPGSGR